MSLNYSRSKVEDDPRLTAILATWEKRKLMCKAAHARRRVDPDDAFQNSVIDTIKLVDRGMTDTGYIVSRIRGSINHEVRSGRTKVDLAIDSGAIMEDTPQDEKFFDPVFSVWLDRATSRLSDAERRAIRDYFWNENSEARGGTLQSALKKLRKMMFGDTVKNHKDDAIYEFVSPEGNVVNMTRHEAIVRIGRSAASISGLLNGKIDKTGGWRLK